MSISAPKRLVEKPCEIQRVNGKPSDEWLLTPDEIKDGPDKIS
jgi:hypothetical protein